MREMSENITKISAALAAASKNIGAAKKGSENPFYKSKYANLPAVIEVIKEPLEEQGIIVLQPIKVEDAKTYLYTVLLHSSGEFISSRIPLDITGKEQVLGSRISYLRRYSLQSMMSIPAVDDDGEAAMGRGDSDKKDQLDQPQNETQDRVYLDANFEFKDALKRDGAMFDPEKKAWYTSANNIDLIKKYTFFNNRNPKHAKYFNKIISKHKIDESFQNKIMNTAIKARISLNDLERFILEENENLHNILSEEITYEDF